MGLGSFIEHGDFFTGNLDMAKVIIECVLEKDVMSDFWMDAMEMSNHLSDFVAKSISLNEDFV